MTHEQIYKKLPLKKSDKVVVIIGSSATGKTFIADLLKKKYSDFKLYHTDDYMEHGFKEALYKLRDDLAYDISPRKMIEGVQGVRLLRKGLELNDFFADVIIICDATMKKRVNRYAKRGEAHKIDKLAGFDKMLGKIFKDYLDALPSHPCKKPRILTITT